MNKLLLRSVALLLVPCLIADPVTAASLSSRALFTQQMTTGPVVLRTSVFDQQAIPPSLLEFIPSLIPLVGINHRGLEAAVYRLAHSSSIASFTSSRYPTLLSIAVTFLFVLLGSSFSTRERLRQTRRVVDRFNQYTREVISKGVINVFELASMPESQVREFAVQVSLITYVPWGVSLLGAGLVGSGISGFIRDAVFEHVTPSMSLLHSGFIIIGLGLYGLSWPWMRHVVDKFLKTKQPGGSASPASQTPELLPSASALKRGRLLEFRKKNAEPPYVSEGSPAFNRVVHHELKIKAKTVLPKVDHFSAHVDLNQKIDVQVPRADLNQALGNFTEHELDLTDSATRELVDSFCPPALRSFFHTVYLVTFRFGDSDQSYALGLMYESPSSISVANFAEDETFLWAYQADLMNQPERPTVFHYWGTPFPRIDVRLHEKGADLSIHMQKRTPPAGTATGGWLGRLYNRWSIQKVPKEEIQLFRAPLLETFIFQFFMVGVPMIVASYVVNGTSSLLWSWLLGMAGNIISQRIYGSRRIHPFVHRGTDIFEPASKRDLETLQRRARNENFVFFAGVALFQILTLLFSYLNYPQTSDTAHLSLLVGGLAGLIPGFLGALIYHVATNAKARRTGDVVGTAAAPHHNVKPRLSPEQILANVLRAATGFSPPALNPHPERLQQLQKWRHVIWTAMDLHDDDRWERVVTAILEAYSGTLPWNLRGIASALKGSTFAATRRRVLRTLRPKLPTDLIEALLWYSGDPDAEIPNEAAPSALKRAA
jgi:hypothetical protein